MSDIKRVRVLLVGDEPSKKNTNPNKAFIGSQSGKILQRWIDYLGLNEYEMVNSNKHNDLVFIKEMHFRQGYVVVALGEKASDRLIDIDVLHFKMPHPSPRNRKLNNKEYVYEMLDECSQYLIRRG